MKTCTLKADDNFHEIYEGLRRTSEIDPRHRENRYSRWPWQRPNTTKYSRTQKKKIGLGKMEAVKWP